MRGVEVHAAHDEHVVAPAAQAGDAGHRAPARARLLGDRADVAGAVAQQRQRLLGQGGEDQLALLAGPDGLAGGRFDDLHQEVVLLHVQAGAHGQALGRDAGPAHLREAVEVHGGQAELTIDLGTHRLGPRLAAEEADLELERRGIDPGVLDRLGDDERVGRRRDERLAAEVREQHRLARGEPPRDRDHGRADALGALVEAMAAGEQAVGVGVVDEHARPDARHRHAPRHQLGPRVEVGACVAHDRRLAVGAAGGVHAHELLARNREQPEGVVVAQVGLGGEGQAREVVERRISSRPSRAAVARRRSSWQCAQPFAVERFDGVPDRVLRRGAERHSSAPRGWRRARG